jgi:hypothetical protein
MGTIVSSNASLSVIGFQLDSGLVLSGDAGSHFQVEWSTNLSNPGWTVLTNFYQPSSPVTIQEATNISTAQRFYRVSLLP